MAQQVHPVLSFCIAGVQDATLTPLVRLPPHTCHNLRMLGLETCSGAGPTSFRKFKEEGEYGGAPLKPYPGPPYMPGSPEAREVEMRSSAGSLQGLLLHPAKCMLCSQALLQQDLSLVQNRFLKICLPASCRCEDRHRCFEICVLHAVCDDLVWLTFRKSMWLVPAQTGKSRCHAQLVPPDTNS